jgi:GT2 family glycosyltransferase
VEVVQSQTVAELSIIIVNWNCLDYTRECLASIYSNPPDSPFEVIVVDNASTTDAPDLLKGQFPKIRLVKNRENLGFARANNVGCRESIGSYLLFLNPDTLVLDNALGWMLGQLKSLPDAGAVGCRLLNSDGTIQTSCIQRFPTIWNQALDADALRTRWPLWKLWGMAPLFTECAAPVSVEVISGACLMVRRSVFEAVGQFSAEYYMYAEDVDLCYSMRLLGWQCYYVNAGKVIHHGGGSSKQRREHNWATVMQRKAILQFCRKTKGPVYSKLYQMAIGLSATVRLVALLPLLLISRLTSVEGNVRLTMSKWSAVLAWALGVQNRSK